MALVRTLVLLTSAVLAAGQRPFYAGSRPIGFPEVEKKTTTPSALVDKFGEVTTQRLPIEAQGDKDLIDRLSKYPIDKQPFWFINWQANEANREKPQTYPLKPNPFAEGIQQNTNVPINTNAGFDIANPTRTGDVTSDTGVQTPNRNSSQNALNTNNNVKVEDRYGTDKNANPENTTPGTHSDSNISTNTDNKEARPESTDVGSTTGDTKKPESVINSDSVLSDPVVKNNNANENENITNPIYTDITTNNKTDDNIDDRIKYHLDLISLMVDEVLRRANKTV